MMLIREIATVLVVKTLLLFVLLHLLAPGSRAVRADSGGLAQHLLGPTRISPSLEHTHDS